MGWVNLRQGWKRLFSKNLTQQVGEKAGGCPPSVDSAKPRIQMFCLLLRSSKSITLAVSLKLLSRRLEQTFSSSLTRSVRFSVASSRDERRWPCSSTVERTWSNLFSNWLKEVSLLQYSLFKGTL